jgi:hypothetical protein
MGRNYILMYRLGYEGLVLFDGEYRNIMKLFYFVISAFLPVWIFSPLLITSSLSVVCFFTFVYCTHVWFV